MKCSSFLLCSLVLCVLNAGHAQSNRSTPLLDALDKSHFSWKGFSFNRSFTALKNTCGLKKIESYGDDYDAFSFGELTDTSKTYALLNQGYLELNGVSFDETLLHIKGAKKSQYWTAALYFVKTFEDSSQASQFYIKTLTGYKKTYGKAYTEHLAKYNEEIAKSGPVNSVYNYLSASNPFDAVEKTVWAGKENITVTLQFVQSRNLILLSIDENPFFSAFSTNNLFRQSEYEENFTKAFKDFDSNNGYKKIKFGQLKSTIAQQVKIKGPNTVKEYAVLNPDYKTWFYIPFDECSLHFNKKNQLYDVTLSKYEFTTPEYEKLLQELVELFGATDKYKQQKNGSEFTVWDGLHFYFYIMRIDNVVYVDFNSVQFDDSAATDKLY